MPCNPHLPSIDDRGAAERELRAAEGLRAGDA